MRPNQCIEQTVLRMICRLLVIGVTFGIGIGMPGRATAALENAWGYDDWGNNGVYAAIESAFPAIRDGGTQYNFSYMRTGGQRFLAGSIRYVEIGWISTGDNPYPNVYWTYKDVNGNTDQGYGPPAYCCYGYNYMVLADGNARGWWGLYFDSVNDSFVDVWTGYDYLENYFSGGETSSSANAMGVSGNYNVQFMRGGYWYCGCNHQVWITNPIYHVGTLPYTSSWQVWGNN